MRLRRKDNASQRAALFSGPFALGISVGVFGALLLSIWLSSLGFSFTREEFIGFAPAFAAVAVAAASAMLSLIALQEQRRMRQAGTDPQIIAHFGQREDARELVTFNITNVGAGAAVNVKIDVEKPEADEELEKRNIWQNVFKRHHPFRVIPQNETISFSLALGWDLLGTNPLPAFPVRLRYEDIDGGEYFEEFVLDIREMELLGSEKSPTMRAVTALEKIAKQQN